MSSVAVDLSLALRWADPKPTGCSRCFRGADATVDFVDLVVPWDGPTMTHPESGAVISSYDDFYLCASRDENGRLTGGCAREFIEFCGYRPELHARQLREIKRLEVVGEHWRDAEARAQREVAKLREYIAELEAATPSIGARRR